MAEQETNATRDARIRQVMDELGVSHEAAGLYVAVESGDAFVNDRISLGPDESLDPELEADLARCSLAPGTGHRADGLMIAVPPAPTTPAPPAPNP